MSMSHGTDPQGWRRVPKWIRVPLVATVGVTVLAIGVALLVLPGPGLVVIAVGIGILATEFAWARHTLHRGRAGIRRVWPRRPPPSSSSPPAPDVP